MFESKKAFQANYFLSFNDIFFLSVAQLFRLVKYATTTLLTDTTTFFYVVICIHSKETFFR